MTQNMDVLVFKTNIQFDEDIANATPASAVAALLRTLRREVPDRFEAIMQSLSDEATTVPELAWATP